MNYKKGDRILYNRQKFGTVHFDQSVHSEVAVVFDREEGKIALVRYDRLELVADAHHEAVLAALISNPQKPETGPHGLAEELTKIADDLAAGADSETNVLRLRTTMLHVSHRLRSIAEEL